MELKGKTRLVILLLLAGVLTFSGVVFAGTTGKIAGKVVDKETGETLPGVNVIIEGTGLGASTDLEGRYFILNIPIGAYTLKASMIGYVEMEIRNVEVIVDLTTTINFSLKPTIIEVAEAITVTAERPLIQRDATGTIRVVTVEEIQNLPTRGYEEVVALQAGVTQFAENEGTRIRGQRPRTNTPMMSIRGGRGDEVAYYVDGFLQQDPLTGISTTNINNNAIEQVVIQTGGFNAEYGRIMSGTVNVITKSGTRTYHGQFGAGTDNLARDWVKTNAYDYNRYDFALGGPVIPGNDKLTFYFSGEKRWDGDRRPSALGDNFYNRIEGWGVPDSTTIQVTKDSTVTVPSLVTSLAEEYKDGRLPHNTLDGLSWQGKLDFKLTNALDLKLGTLGSVDKWEEYRHAYVFSQDHSPRIEDKNYSYFAKLTHMLSPSTFYTLAGNYYMTTRESGDGVYWNDLKRYARPGGPPRYDQECLFMRWDDIDGPTPVQIDSVTGYITGGDEAHVYGDYSYRQSSYAGVDLDITSQVTPSHQIQAGFDLQRHTLRFYDNLIPTLLWRGYDMYKDVVWYGFERNSWRRPAEQDTSELNSAKHPITAAIYLQDKFDYQGIVINAGIRYDYLYTGAKWLKDEDYPLGKYQDPTTLDWHDDSQLNAKDETDASGYFHPADLEDAKDQHYISPRLSIGFPVTDRTVFHVSYGSFFQQPKLQRLYVDYEYLEYMVAKAPYYYYFGNPNLKVEKTIAYEAGITQQLGQNTRLDITAYYKDVKDLVQVASISSFPNSFNSFRNQDFGTIKGVDFSLKMRRTKHVAANLDYSLSYATGTGSVETTHYKIAWTSSEVPKMTAPLAHDQRHKIKINLDLRTRKGEGPVLAGIRPLQRAGVNFVFNAGSGGPYCPMKVYNEVSQAAVFPSPIGPVNSAYSPWTYRLDLKADKTISLGGLDLNFYVWVLNFFDRKNAVDVYEASGQPNTTNWLATADGQKFVEDFDEPHDSSGLTGEQKYELTQEDPYNYGTPRVVRVGMLVSF